MNLVIREVHWCLKWVSECFFLYLWASCFAEYRWIVRSAAHLSWYSAKFELSADHRKLSLRGEVSRLLWLFLHLACMVLLCMCHSIVLDTCGTYIIRKMHSVRSKETFDVVNKLRWALVGHYAFIFANHPSMLKKSWIVNTFTVDRVRCDDEWTGKSTPLVKRSFGTILTSYAAINAYLLLLQLGLLFLQLQLDRTDSQIAPVLEHRIFSSALCYAALFLYTYQTFDIRTNLIFSAA